MGRKPNYYNQVLDLLRELHTKYPSFNLCRHMATSLHGYHDIWGVPDKELLYALEKYKIQLELDETPITEGKQLKKIEEDAMHLSLDDLLEESED